MQKLFLSSQQFWQILATFTQINGFSLRIYFELSISQPRWIHCCWIYLTRHQGHEQVFAKLGVAELCINVSSVEKFPAYPYIPLLLHFSFNNIFESQMTTCKDFEIQKTFWKPFSTTSQTFGSIDQIGQIHFGVSGVFSAELSASFLELWIPCLWFLSFSYLFYKKTLCFSDPTQI